MVAVKMFAMKILAIMVSSRRCFQQNRRYFQQKILPGKCHLQKKFHVTETALDCHCDYTEH